MIPEAALAGLRDRAALFALLHDHLGWPVDPADTFTYQEPLPAADETPDIAVSRLVPFSGDDPFVILLAEFRSPFRRGALRRVLQAIRRKLRSQAAYLGKSLEDLVFLCVLPDWQGLRFARFQEQEGRQPRLAVFGWDQDNVGETRTLREVNLPALSLGLDPAGRLDWSAERQASWRSAWDVERVTRQFFTAWHEVFAQVEDRLAATIPAADRRRLYTQRLFNRLLFIAFIQKKGWLRFGERTDYLAALYEAALASGESYLNDRLYWAFFAGLGAHADLPYVQDHADLVARRGTVPFLNGGLFEMEDELDAQRAVDLPNDAFAAIVHGPDALFNRFRFTVTESTPDDVEVAVDPEMLGKVFEELVTGRHEQGAYYTPKPIVSFMCREALKCYLETTLDNPSREAIEQFVEAHNPEGLANPEAVLAALQHVHVCDPACGSGAYLLGMLHELLDLRTCLFATRRIDARTAYERKLQIIQGNLYGVDKDPFAVNIARLRLWLSLAVEYERDDPPPLPNLDFKIEVGDSLTGPQPPTSAQLSLATETVEQYIAAKAAHLTAVGERKKALAAQVADHRRELTNWVQSAATGTGFDWGVEFAEVFAARGGFDIVVANPPYVRHELLGREYKEDCLRPIHPEVYTGTADLYVYFFSRAHQLLCANGTACFISSNKWLRAGYGEKLRDLILNRHAMLWIVDFGDLPVFQAVAYPCIFQWRNQPRDTQVTRWATVQDLSACYAEGVAQHAARVAVQLTADSFSSNGPCTVASLADAGLAHMQGAGCSLAEYVKERIYFGVKTGLNEAFVVDRQTRDRLIAEDPASAEVLKPLLAGTDVLRYEVAFREQWLVWTHVGVAIERYPAVHRHLATFEERARQRSDQGNHWWELRPCTYYAAFDAPKIIYPQIAETQRFMLDEQAYYPLKTVYTIAASERYLLAVLNSASATRWFEANLTRLRGGYLEFYTSHMGGLPIPDAPAAARRALDELVTQTQDHHASRRALVEQLLSGVGTSPAHSTSKWPLEQPWLLTPEEFRAQAKRKRLACDEALFREVHDETAALTAEIETIEAEIDARVAALYGL